MTNTAKKIQKRPHLTPILKTKRMPRRSELALCNDNLFALFGWDELPPDLKSIIAADLAGFRDELLGLYSTRDEGVLNRRKTVAYWVNNFLSDCCSLETAKDMLKADC